MKRINVERRYPWPLPPSWLGYLTVEERAAIKASMRPVLSSHTEPLRLDLVATPSVREGHDGRNHPEATA